MQTKLESAISICKLTPALAIDAAPSICTPVFIIAASADALEQAVRGADLDFHLGTLLVGEDV